MNEQKQSLSIPVAIIVAGALIAGGIYFSGRGSAPAQNGGTPVAQEVAISAVGSEDHVLGDPKADIVIVEYSDIECPFCKNFHNTLHQLMKEYGSSGQLAWVFRHMPLPMHSKAIKEAEATECAAELGGTEAFWKYIDRVFQVTPSNDGLDLAQLPVIAAEIGLDKTAFTACLDSGKMNAKVLADRDEALAAGAQGTPYSVIFAKGQRIPLTQGALPYQDMKQIIEAIIKG